MWGMEVGGIVVVNAYYNTNRCLVERFSESDSCARGNKICHARVRLLTLKSITLYCGGGSGGGGSGGAGCQSSIY